MYSRSANKTNIQSISECVSKGTQKDRNMDITRVQLYAKRVQKKRDYCLHVIILKILDYIRAKGFVEFSMQLIERLSYRRNYQNSDM